MARRTFALGVAVAGLSASIACSTYYTTNNYDQSSANIYNGGAASSGSAGPSIYRAVHLDTLLPEKAATFEQARKDFVAALHAAHASDHRGWFFAVEGVGFLTMRPFARFAELDAVREDRDELASLPKEALDRYDERSDVSLAFPHRSEIWRVDDELSYAPSVGAVDEFHAVAGRIVIEDARPDTASEEAYSAAWVEEKKALTSAKYPLSKVVFRSVFGSGRIVAMWLASSKEALDKAPSLEAALTAQLGQPRAKELATKIDACVLHRDEHALTPRPDLSSP